MSSFRISMLFSLLLLSTFRVQAQSNFIFPIEVWGQDTIMLNQSTYGLQLESIFQSRADNFERISQFSPRHTYRKVSHPIGRLDIKVKSSTGVEGTTFCTASIISSTYVITNNHCLDNPNYEVLQVSLLMGFDGNSSEPTRRYAVDLKPAETSTELDYAILNVEDNPSLNFGVVNLGFSEIDYDSTEELFILHHPGAKAKRLTRKDCRIFPSSASDSPQIIKHRCDTLPGSSGALLFSDISNTIVGLHYAGTYYNSPTSFNQAISFEYIAAKSDIIGSLLKAALLQAAEVNKEPSGSEKASTIVTESTMVLSVEPLSIYRTLATNETSPLVDLKLISNGIEDIDLPRLLQTINKFEYVDTTNLEMRSGIPVYSKIDYHVGSEPIFLQTEGCAIEMTRQNLSVDPLDFSKAPAGMATTSLTSFINLSKGGARIQVKETSYFDIEIRNNTPGENFEDSINIGALTEEDVNFILRQLAGINSKCQTLLNANRIQHVRAALESRTGNLATLMLNSFEDNIQDQVEITHNVCHMWIRLPEKGGDRRIELFIDYNEPFSEKFKAFDTYNIKSLEEFGDAMNRLANPLIDLCKANILYIPSRLLY